MFLCPLYFPVCGMSGVQVASGPVRRVRPEHIPADGAGDQVLQAQMRLGNPAHTCV